MIRVNEWYAWQSLPRHGAIFDLFNYIAAFRLNGFWKMYKKIAGKISKIQFCYS